MTELTSELGIYDAADGSCDLRRGDIRSVVILQGPCQISSDNEKAYRHVGNINFHLTSYQFDDPQPGDSLLYDLIENCIDRSAYARTEFIIHANSEGLPGANALTFNSASLCLLDAAIQMNYFFGAISVALLQDSRTDAISMEVDPDSKVLSNAKAVFVFVFKPSLLDNLLIGSCSHGRFTLDEFEEALVLARGRCLHVFDFIRNQMRKKLVVGIETKRM